MRRHLATFVAVLAVVVPCAVGACTQDFDQFSSGQASGQGGGTTAATSGSNGGATTGDATSGGTGGSASGTGGSASGTGGSASSASSASSTGSGGPVCGNGDQEKGEDCDDSNTTPADGCSPTCTDENPEDCGGVSILLTNAGLTITGDTSGANNDAGELPCGGGSSGDFVYRIEPAQDGTFVATLEGDFATHLYARSDCPGQNNDNLACSDTHGPATLTMQVKAGEVFDLFVDGYGGSAEEGAFTLTLELN